MINYHHYINGIREQKTYYSEQLSSNQIRGLKDDIMDLGYKGWISWQTEEHVLISDFLSSTASRAEKLKKFQQYRSRLHLSGIQKCDEALALLVPLSQTIFTIQTSTPREIVNEASDCFWDIIENEKRPWPFGENCPFILKKK